MKYLVMLTVAATLAAQTPQAVLSQKDAEQLATRMVQLIESTAFAVPGLTRASEPVKQNAEMTFTAMQRTPMNAALTYQFINHVKAYLALSDSIPRPYPFPQTADQQYAELREDLQRMQQHFEGLLEAQNHVDRNRAADPNQIARYATENAKLPPPGKNPRVVFTGDSITDYWRLNEYFPGQDFVNRGIAGQTTTQVLARFEQDVIGLHPKAVVVLAGTNDLGRSVPLSQIEDNLALMGDAAKAHGIKAAFASILPTSDYHKDVDPRNEQVASHPIASIRALNAWLADHCRAEGFVYIDYYSALVDASGQMQ
ncbi:MAG TPA: GDSL-type esterase/lipase family protein, partial [Bryobacteraceae bacterium]|nr:GDSL-type esterase/lipase family protein [Bryobacteraceae bacterium]